MTDAFTVKIEEYPELSPSGRARGEQLTILVDQTRQLFAIERGDVSIIVSAERVVVHTHGKEGMVDPVVVPASMIWGDGF